MLKFIPIPRRRSLFPALCATALLMLGALIQPARAAEPALTVVATFSILGDFTQRIGGERVRVHTLVGPNADAHVYQPTPADGKTLARAALVVSNGLGFEGWIERLVKSSGYRGELLVASQGVPPLTNAAHDDGAKPGHGHGVSQTPDPHAWQDPANARRYVDNIAQGLATVDPAGKSLYLANADRLKRDIGEVDAEIRRLFAALPAERRKVVGSHDAFAYFSRAYGVRFISAVGLSTDAEASAADIGRIIRLIRKERIPAIFMENVSDPRLLERIRAETGARIGGTLYPDSLSRADGPAQTYLAMMRHNAKTLAAALSD